MVGRPLFVLSCYTYNVWCEGIGCSNVVVRNCRFENCLSSRYENMPQIIVSMQTPPEHWPQKHERITHEAFAREVEAMVAAGHTVKPCRDAVCDILVECKAVDKLVAEHRQQLWNYMRLTGKQVGILYNFAPPMDQAEHYYLDTKDGVMYMF